MRQSDSKTWWPWESIVCCVFSEESLSRRLSVHIHSGCLLKSLCKSVGTIMITLQWHHLMLPPCSLSCTLQCVWLFIATVTYNGHVIWLITTDNVWPMWLHIVLQCNKQKTALFLMSGWVLSSFSGKPWGSMDRSLQIASELWMDTRWTVDEAELFILFWIFHTVWDIFRCTFR